MSGKNAVIKVRMDCPDGVNRLVRIFLPMNKLKAMVQCNGKAVTGNVVVNGDDISFHAKGKNADYFNLPCDVLSK